MRTGQSLEKFSTERERLAPRLKNLQSRARLLGAIRQFFVARDFVEIEAPILVPSPGLELHLDAFAVENHYLITSPEYQMKRLLAGGMERIYSLGKVFRRGENGRHHNPEFTMLEWYRSGVQWQAIADDVEKLVSDCARALCGTTVVRGVDFTPPWQRLTVRDACLQFARVAIEGGESPADLRKKIRAGGWRAPDDGDFSDLFFTLFLDAVEPRLPSERPIILYDWPRPLCALARVSPSNPNVVERFEAYAGGIELCNAFGELIDPIEQRARLQADVAARHQRGLPIYPVDERFLAAVGEMAPASGVALGVDRLAMLLLGTTEIRDVLAFAFDEL